jgi:hypothetical protein
MSSKIKNIENRGWEGMSTLLDKHLPQEKKKRPVFPFWSATAAASLFIISSIFVLKTNDVENAGIVSDAKSIETKSIQIQDVDQKTTNDVTEKVTEEVFATSSPKLSKKLQKIDEPIVQNKFDQLSFNTQKPAFRAINDNSSSSYLNMRLNNSSVASIKSSVDDAGLNNNVALPQPSSYNSDLTIVTPSENSNIEENKVAIINKVETIIENQVIDNNLIAQTQSIIKDVIDVAANEEGLTLVKTPIKNDFYVSTGLNGIFNTEDKTKSASIGVDLGYKIKKLSVELGGEYITSNSVKLSPIEINDYIASRSFNVQAIQLPIENLSKSTLISFKNGNLLALNLKMNYELSNKLGVFAGLQRSQGTSLEQLQFSNNSTIGTFDTKNQFLDLSNQTSYGLSYVGKEKSSFSYILGLSYKILKRLNINVGVRSNYRPKNSINEYAVANNLPLFTVGASYQMF